MLLAAGGPGTSEIVIRTGVSKPTVIAWEKRYAAEGIGGWRTGRGRAGRRRFDEVAVVLATLEPPPEKLGVTHWSCRLLAAQLGISNVWVAKIWRRWGLQPWRRETFKLSTDPQLEAKVRDVVGLYLAPPERAVVLCVDEKSRASRGADEAVREEVPAAGHRGDRSKLEADWGRRRSPLNDSAPSWPGLFSAERRVLDHQRKLHRWARADPDRRFGDVFKTAGEWTSNIDTLYVTSSGPQAGRRARLYPDIRRCRRRPQAHPAGHRRQPVPVHRIGPVRCAGHAGDGSALRPEHGDAGPGQPRAVDRAPERVAGQHHFQRMVTRAGWYNFDVTASRWNPHGTELADLLSPRATID